jgi:tetratricopeptide (TPR) repeat protein
VTRVKQSLRSLVAPSAARRSFRNGLLAACFISGLIFGGPALAQSAPALSGTGTAKPATKAVAQLFENVAFWTQRGQPTIAVQDLERAIALAPPDADTLALAARLNFQLDRYEAADAYRLRLQKLSPDDPRLPALAAEQKRTPEELRILAEARRLTAAGRKDDAIKSYRQFFKNKVPDSLAIEYYTILGTTSPEGFKIATDELPKVAARWPGDASFKLANAQLLTFQESTRSAGITQLAELTKVPIVAAGARVAWHDALLWQGADINSRDQIDLYLKENPSDPQLEAKRKEIQDSLPDEGLLARMRAYEDGAAGRKDEAEKGFLEALRINPDDAEAMIVLSIMRRDQKRLKESDELIAKAFALAPDRKEEFIGTIGFDPDTLRNTAKLAGGAGGTAQSAAAGRQIAADYARVKTFTDQGKYDDAEKLLRRLTGKNWNGASYLSLGYIQKAAGKLPEAETSFRSGLKADPRNADCMLALADVLAKQNKPDEVDSLYARARESYAKQRNKNGLQALNRAQSDRMRTQAQADTDPTSAIRSFRAALDVDPSNPWLRLDLARALQKQGDTAEAKKLMAQAVATDRPTTDALQAAILFADQSGDLDETNRLISRLPSNDRTTQMRDAQTRLTARTQVQQALAGGPGARDRLLALASQPDPNGVWVGEIGRALLKTRDRATLRDAVAAGVAATPEPTPQQRLVYSGILLGGEQTNDAAQMIGPLDRASLDSAQQRNLDQLLNGIALQQADKLAQRGKGREAVTYLEPRLSAQPDDTGLNLGLSRAYLTSGKSSEALDLTSNLLKSKPDDLNIRIATIDAAIANGDQDRAQDLVARGIEQFPNDAQLYVRSANLKMANGHKQEALADFRKARDLRQKQLSQ